MGKTPLRHCDWRYGTFARSRTPPDFFEALRAYRAVLAQASSHTAVQGLKGEIDLLLWQDLGGSQPECWTSRFRDGVRLLPEPEKGLWLGLWHAFCYSPIPGPPRHWKTDAAIGAIGPERVKERLLEWISLPAAGTPALRMTTAGSAALKNIVWVATKIGASALDDALHETLLSQWKNPRLLDKVAAAMCHLWNQRNRQDKLHAIRKLFPV